jgi:hypothetical protein
LVVALNRESADACNKQDNADLFIMPQYFFEGLHAVTAIAKKIRSAS